VKRITLAVLAVLALPASQSLYAQPATAEPGKAVAHSVALAHRHYDGLLMENRGDDRGAYLAFREAAEGGYPPAQRKLGEIYDTGNAAVPRNYEESIRWYQKARDGGEQIPPPKPRMPSLQ
jgi:TPR repeat protein